MIQKLSVLLLVGLIAVGCRRLPPPPDGLPPLYPCKITVTFGGEAIEGVAVTLIPEDPAVKWRSGGRTDANGMVELKTSFAYSGVPEGSFRVGFDKTEDSVGKTLEEMMPISLFPVKYRPERTKETIEVKPEKNEFVFILDGGRERLPVSNASSSKR